MCVKWGKDKRSGKRGQCEARWWRRTGFVAEEEVCICGCCPSLVVSLDSPIGEVWEKKGYKGACTDCAVPVRSVMLLVPWEQLLKAET